LLFSGKGGNALSVELLPFSINFKGNVDINPINIIQFGSILIINDKSIQLKTANHGEINVNV
jgi:hypothetical protein